MFTFLLVLIVIFATQVGSLKISAGQLPGEQPSQFSQHQALYNILGLEPGATRSEIRVAFDHLANRYHPIINDLDEAYAIFCKAARTFEVLFYGFSRNVAPSVLVDFYEPYVLFNLPRLNAIVDEWEIARIGRRWTARDNTVFLRFVESEAKIQAAKDAIFQGSADATFDKLHGGEDRPKFDLRLEHCQLRKNFLEKLRRPVHNVVYCQSYEQAYLNSYLVSYDNVYDAVPKIPNQEVDSGLIASALHLARYFIPLDCAVGVLHCAKNVATAATRKLLKTAKKTADGLVEGRFEMMLYETEAMGRAGFFFEPPGFAARFFGDNQV